jgi:hypothetical protein
MGSYRYTEGMKVKTLIFMMLFVISACTNDTRDAQIARNTENPSLHTVGYIGNVKVQVGFAQIKE